MAQLNAKDVFDYLCELKNNGEDLSKLQVYLGNDDEINGVHCGWSIDLIDKKDEDFDWIVEMIDEDCCNLPLKNKGIFIS